MTPEQFMANFGAIAEAPDGIAELRHLVLVLGLTGRLHTGDDGDESIESLVERSEVPLPVSGRKSRAGKEASAAVIPGDAALSVGHPGTKPPKGWVWFPMHEVACLESGHTPSRRYPEYWDGDIAWIGIKDAREHHGGRIDETMQHVTQAGLDNSAARLLPAGTVCLSRTASVGYVIEMGRSMATSQDFVNWVCSAAVFPSFLVKLLLAESRALRRFSKGAVHQTIYFPEVKAFHVCLPPLAEQKRIVAQIDQLMAMLDDLEQRQEKKRTVAIHVSKASLDSLVNAEDPDQLARAWERVSQNFGVVAGADGGLEGLRTVVATLGCTGALTRQLRRAGRRGEAKTRLDRLLEERRVRWEEAERAKQELAKSNKQRASLGKYVEPNTVLDANLPELPASWIWATLDVLTFFSVDYRGMTPPLAPSGIPVVSAANVRDGRVVLDAERCVSEETYRKRLVRGQARPGDLVITTEAPVAKVALFPQERCLLTRRVLACQMLGVEPAFVLRYFRTATAARHIQRHLRGSTAPRILKPDLLSLPVPVPPRAEQKLIIARVDQLMTMIDDLKAKSAGVEAAATRLASAATSAA